MTTITEQIDKLKREREESIIIAMLDGTAPAREIATRIGLTTGHEISSPLRSLTKKGLVTSEVRTEEGNTRFVYWLTAAGNKKALELRDW